MERISIGSIKDKQIIPSNMKSNKDPT